MNRALNEFKPDELQMKAVIELNSRDRWSHYGYSAAWTLGCLIAYWCAVSITGWVVRGFMGIKWGSDS